MVKKVGWGGNVGYIEGRGRGNKSYERIIGKVRGGVD